MIYLDNSATTNPKPQEVKNAVSRAMNYYSFNSGRGGYKESVNTSNMIFSCRESLSQMFGFSPENIAFTQNCTTALNYAIKGIVKPGDHIIISNLEHNAVARPVNALFEKGIIEYDLAEFSFDKEEIINNFKKLIKPNTKLIVCMHASNVFGCVFPIREIGKLAHDNGIIFVVDAAQSAGVLDIDAKRDNIDILCAPGHKGLYAPMGTGFIALGDNIKLDTIIEGGTGSESMNLAQPDNMPERLESGTLNNVGISGLLAGTRFVNAKGISNIYKHENRLMQYVYKELSKNQNVTLYTPCFNDFLLAPILSFNYKDYPSEKTASLLAEKNIATRAGFQCSKLAHTAFGTQNRGTVRISPSVFTKYSECENFINILKKL
ncbi:MAG: aminotransferase class V-fold PLP-dependent enzyme [Eubacterium sp.]|nr:aminotransferase class V-fold PLP-dependent enzyme [Eubacterium sp.]